MCFQQGQPANRTSPPRFVERLRSDSGKYPTHSNINHSRSSNRNISKVVTSKPLPALPDHHYEHQSKRVRFDISNTRLTLKRIGKTNNWSQATNASLDMIWQNRNSSQSKRASSRGPIVRFNRQKQGYRQLPYEEQSKYEQGQTQQQERREDRRGPASPSLEDMMGRMQIVNEDMAPDVTQEVIQGLGATFPDIPFVVVGKAALVYYGRRCNVSAVVMACPASSAANVHGWARAKGLRPFPGCARADSFGYQTAGGHVCRVEVRAVADDEFASIGVTAPARGDRAKVMTAPWLVHEYARLYTAGQHTWHRDDKTVIGADIRWLLRVMVALRRRGDRRAREFTEREVAYVLAPAFWGPFTAEHPESVELFREAGALRWWHGGGGGGEGEGRGIEAGGEGRMVAAAQDPAGSDSLSAPTTGRASDAWSYSASEASYVSSIDVGQIGRNCKSPRRLR